MSDFSREDSLQTNSIQRLASSLGAITAMVESIPESSSDWVAESDQWCLREVLGHLIDGDREIFRARLELFFSGSLEEWPALNPEEWVIERKYSERPLRELLRLFQDERQRSLAWLASLEDPDWFVERTLPDGSLKAGDLLLAWCTHDVLHLEQIARWCTAKALHDHDPFRDDFAF